MEYTTNHLFIILGLSAAGIFNAWHLYRQYLWHRHDGRRMVCPLRGKCDVVVASKFGWTLGVKNELWGIFYYVGLIILVGIFSFVPQWQDGVGVLMIMYSFGAILFTLYLLVVQFAILRQYCSWCLFASAINFAIFAAEIYWL